MEGAAVLSTQGNGRFRGHLKSAAGALCRAGASAALAVSGGGGGAGGARTLPKQRVSAKQPAVQHHHTFPKAAAAGQRQSSLGRHLGGLFRTPPPPSPSAATPPAAASPAATPPPPLSPAWAPEALVVEGLDLSSGLQKLKGKMAREVASAWCGRVGAPGLPAPADHVQALFNDLHLYPTKTQVFEMLVCARQCARRKSLSLTFGEFCVFAAELRKCSRRSRQASSKPESPCRVEPAPSPREKGGLLIVNGSEASPPPPPCEVFLGGSCNPTTWRSEIAIPILEQMGITYFNPQVAEWSLELVEVENRAKQAARALLFVLDSETRAVAAGVEAAQLAALPRDLLLVLRPYRRGQRIGDETISDQEYVELSRARATLQEAVERRGLPAFTDIPSALRCARTVLRGARTHPRQPLGQTILRLKRAFDAAGARAGRVSRARALAAAAELARVSRHAADRCLPAADSLDFESFCAAVAELTADHGERAAPWCAGSPPVTRGVAERVRRVFRNLRERMSGPPSPGAAPAATPASAASAACAASAAEAACSNGESAPSSPVESRCAQAPRDAPASPAASPTAAAAPARERSTNGYEAPYSSRLKACGKKLSILIPKSGSAAPREGAADGGSGGDSVLTPSTEQRLQRLPAMLGAAGSPAHADPLAPASPGYKYDVYLGGCIPKSGPRPEERLRAAGLTYVVPRVNDYTRMFSAPARRAAPAHPDSPRTDKKPRPSPVAPSVPSASAASPAADDDVQLREKEDAPEPSDRLSASDFYTVTDDLTPQPFKGTYDEELMWGSRVLLFCISSQAPCFSAMVLAAHYMELRPAATVLLVQTLERVPTLSENATKDYNRGRHYLADLARRSGVPVFDSTEEALACVLGKLSNTQQPSAASH